MENHRKGKSIFVLFQNLFDKSCFFHIIRAIYQSFAPFMLHTIIIQDPSIFRLMQEKTEAKKVPLSHISYEMYSHGNIRIVGGYTMSPQEILSSIKEELNPDTIFFLSQSYPVSDEKLAGDIILPNVFFSYNPAISESEISKDMETSLLTAPIFLQHYVLQ